MPHEIYKRHRPASLDRVIGNQDTVQALQNMLERNTVPHSLLFSGPSGAGKTTLARIVQAQLGCDGMDLREYDSSTYRGIDSVREMGRLMHLAPVGKCRVFILDECHQLTKDAQNAALKMLEDTPSHVYFMLCTTDPEKLIKPIRTRCTEMRVHALGYEDLQKLLKRVVKREQAELSDEHAGELIDACQGSARLLLVLLEKIIHLDPAERSKAIQSGMEEETQALDLCRSLIKKTPWAKVANQLKELAGSDVESIRWAVLGYAKAVLLSPKPDPQAFFVIQAFANPFYDTKEAGLAAACYDAIHGE